MFRKLRSVFSRPKLAPEITDCKNEGAPPPPKAPTGQVWFFLSIIYLLMLSFCLEGIYVSKCQRLEFQIYYWRWYQSLFRKKLNKYLFCLHPTIFSLWRKYNFLLLKAAFWIGLAWNRLWEVLINIANGELEIQILLLFIWWYIFMHLVSFWQEMSVCPFWILECHAGIYQPASW